MTTPSVRDALRAADKYDYAAATFGLLLGAAAILLVEFDKHNANVGIGAAIGVLFMTLPVALVRHRPVGVPAFLLVATVVNGLAFGHVVRCGVALPAMFFVAYSVGSRASGRRSWVGLALSLAAVAAQCPFDPRLGWSAVPFLLPLTAIFYAAGRLVRSRVGMVTTLRERNEELRQEQARTAAMAVAADRAQLAGALDAQIASRLDALAGTADSGRNAVGTDAALDALAQIETSGRSALNRMREVVGTLRDQDLKQPPPSLAALPSLARRFAGADVRLIVEGDPESVPSVVEISAYRVVEHLLEIFGHIPDARIDARVQIEPDGVSVAVSGPITPGNDATEDLAKIRARVALHEGELDATTVGGMCSVVARIPVTAGVA